MAYIKAIETAFPNSAVPSKELVEGHPVWDESKVLSKLGIASRFVAPKGVFVSDIVTEAAQKLEAKQPGMFDLIDMLIVCTQTPDYLLPTTACLVHKNLNLKSSVGSFDINLGCSGYIYGLMIASSLIASEAAKNVLLLTGDMYTKLLAPEDVPNRLIFGDGGSATWITSERQGAALELQKFTVGTDGSGAMNLIARQGGLKGIENGPEAGFSMNGPEVFNFTMREVPKLVKENLAKNGLNFEEVSYFIFHQANEFMLESLRKKIDIPPRKYVKRFANFGNTVSSTIPVALQGLCETDVLVSGETLSMVGFGVGYSWAAVTAKVI